MVEVGVGVPSLPPPLPVGVLVGVGVLPPPLPVGVLVGVGVRVGGSAVDVSVILIGRSARTDTGGKAEKNTTISNMPPEMIGRIRQTVCLMVVLLPQRPISGMK